MTEKDNASHSLFTNKLNIMKKQYHEMSQLKQSHFNQLMDVELKFIRLENIAAFAVFGSTLLFLYVGRGWITGVWTLW